MSPTLSRILLTVSLACAGALSGACSDDEQDPTPAPMDALDTTAPTVSITDDVAGVAGGIVNFTFTFSEDVGTSFVADDVAVTGGTAETFTRVSGTVATLSVVPPADAAGTISLTVAAMRFEDAAGNLNAAAATAEQAYDTTSGVDTTPPTVSISDDVAGIATGDVTFTFTFSEPVGTTFTVEDVSTTGGTAGAFSVVSETVATLVVSPPTDATGTLRVTVAAMRFEDAAGNLNVAATTAEQAFNTTGLVFDGVVFDDAFGADVTFEAFDGSINDVSADAAQAQAGASSLRIVVPDSAYTGGALVLAAGGDVSGFNGVTFWARADQARTLNVAGIGNDAADSPFNTEIAGGLSVTPTWTRYTIPLPDPSVLTAQTGLFHFAEGSDEGPYTLWLDEIRYVNLTPGTVTNPRPSIASGTEALRVGETISVGGASIIYSIDGTDVTLTPSAPAFFDYSSSDAAVATVDAFGVVTGVAEGTAVISADLSGVPAAGMVTVNVGEGCPPTGANLAVNGDFETGDFSCVQQFPNAGTQSITTMNPSAGMYAVNLNVVTQDADTVIKFANLTPGAFTPGQLIYIAFDMRGAVTPGGVVFAEFFSELMGGGTSAAEILFGAPILPDSDPETWTPFRTTALTGPDTEGGITLQLKAASGAGTANIFFDNVCVSASPCP